MSRPYDPVMKNDSRIANTGASLTLSILAMSASVYGQAEPAPISTDRPGFLFSPVLVPRGVTQIEAGVPTFSALRGGGIDSTLWSAPVAVRYGLSSALELRASLPAFTAQRVESGGDAQHDRGFADTEVGVKYALNAEASAPLALQASLRLPTGEDPFSSNELGGSAYLLHGCPLVADWSASLLAGVAHTPLRDGEDTTQAALGVLASHSIAEGWSGYGELAAFPGLNNARGQAYAGLGVAWAMTPDVQFDVSADFGLDDDSADVVAALGVSFRL